MTRETKIGLLVGLAFIIVIGILLSDHLSSSTQPPPARLSDAGERARTGVATPVDVQAPPVTLVGTEPATAPVAPVEPIPIPTELRLPSVQFIDSGPWDATALRQDPAVTVGPPPPADRDQARQAPPSPQTDALTLEQVARRHDEQIVPADTRSTPTNRTTETTRPEPAAQVMEYRAQPGDTLSRLAGRFMGGNTPANRDAIVRANPSLQNNPDLIVAGRTYIIPVPDGAAQIASSRQTGPPQPQSERWYTAKEGDSLWKIAADQLGDGTAWMKLKELNEETLRGGEMVRPGMKLRLQ